MIPVCALSWGHSLGGCSITPRLLPHLPRKLGRNGLGSRLRDLMPSRPCGGPLVIAAAIHAVATTAGAFEDSS